MAKVRDIEGQLLFPLTDGWEVMTFPPGETETLEGITSSTVSVNKEWLSAKVPGTVASTRQAAKRWTIYTPYNFDAKEHWYKTRFSLPPSSRPRFLVMEGLATLAEVWLNGNLILQTHNMFVEHRCDVSALLQMDNEIYIRFKSLTEPLKEKRPRPRWRTGMLDEQNLRWFRTTLLGRIGGWSPYAAPVGPWRPIFIEECTHFLVHQADIKTRVEGSDGVVTADIHIQPLEQEINNASLVIEGMSFPLTCRSEGNRVLLSGEAVIPDVALWWPHTHGTSSRYQIKVCVEIAGTTVNIDLGYLGFKTVEWDAGFKINGRSIFCRGACWTPIDVLSLGGDEACYRSALELVRDAGINMLRLSGTMIYEADCFYDLCDEMGILVWQDFMFANMDYPDSDAPFMAEVEVEIRQTLNRLQLHPSLTMFCGNNEVEEQSAMFGLPRSQWTSPLFYEKLPTLYKEYLPNLPYVSSSTTGGAFPFQVNTGVTHYYGVGAYLRPLSDARTSEVQFALECVGFANVPSPQTIREVFESNKDVMVGHPKWKFGTPRDSSGSGWDFDDIRDYYLKELFNVDSFRVLYSDPERYLALSRVVTGEVMAAVFSEWRRARSSCRGALVWFYKDLYPGAGWGIVDCLGRPKAAYYYLKRIFAPLTIFFSDEGLNGLQCHLVNETTSVRGVSLRVAIYREGRVRIVEKTLPLTLLSDTQQEITIAEHLDGFMDVTYAYRFGPPGHDLVVATLFEQDHLLTQSFYFPQGLPSKQQTDIQIEAVLARSVARPLRVENIWELTLLSKSFAQSVAIEIKGYSPEDNYFHLEADQVRTIRLIPTKTAVDKLPPSGTVFPLNALFPIHIRVPS